MVGPPMTSPAPASKSHDIIRGMLLMMAACTCFAFLDSTAKWLSQFYPTGQVVWTRYTVGTLFAIAYAVRALGLGMFRTRRPWLQVARGGLLVVCTALNFLALRYLPLADTLALLFTAPLMTCALSVPLLGEKVGWRRWSAIAVGFAGILLIVRPGFGEMHWSMACAVASAFFGALYNIATRIASAHDHVKVSLVYVSLVGCLLATPSLGLGWATPEGWDWLIFVALGLFGGFGHLLLISAFSHAPASTLAPFSLIFDRLPDLWTAAGIAVIISSGLYLLHRERVLGRGVTAEAKTQER